MEILRYGFEFRDGILYNVKPKIVPKVVIPKLEPEKYEDMLKELQIPVDKYIAEINRLIEMENSVVPMATPVPTRSPRPADAQEIIDKLNKLNTDWRRLNTRFINPEGIRISPKTYLRYMGTIRNDLTKMMTVPNLMPLNEDDLMDVYRKAGELREDIETERRDVKLFYPST